jgi:hypothetical protein
VTAAQALHVQQQLLQMPPTRQCTYVHPHLLLLLWASFAGYSPLLAQQQQQQRLLLLQA